MKKMIVMAAFGLFGAQFAKAQISKGDILVGGTVGIGTNTMKADDNSDDKTTKTNFFISPKVGFAVNDKWMVGVFVGTQFGTDKTEVAGVESKETSNMITPGIFVRNYHNIAGTKLAFFGEANVGYGFGQEKVAGTKTFTNNQLSANIQPGIAYFVTKCFVVEGVFGGLNYTNTTRENEATGIKAKNSSFDFQFTQQFNLGVSFLF